MIKKLFSLVLVSLISLSGVGLVAVQPSRAFDVTVYSTATNRHGVIIKTSVGTFYIGNSGDAIHEAGGHKRRGYWDLNGPTLHVYIADEVYEFYIG